MKTAIALAATLPLLALASPVMKVGSIDSHIAPLLSSTTAAEIPDRYIVVFKDHVTHDVASEHHSWVQTVHTKRSEERAALARRGLLQVPFLETMYEGMKHTYSVPGFLGYSGHFDAETVEAIRRQPDVGDCTVYKTNRQLTLIGCLC